MGTKPRSSERTASTLNYQAISPAPLTPTVLNLNFFLGLIAGHVISLTWGITKADGRGNLWAQHGPAPMCQPQTEISVFYFIVQAACSCREKHLTSASASFTAACPMIYGQVITLKMSFILTKEPLPARHYGTCPQPQHSRMKQKDHELEANQGYIANPCL